MDEMNCTCGVDAWERCVAHWAETMLKKCYCHVSPNTCEVHNGGYVLIPKGTAPSREELEKVVSCRRHFPSGQ